MFEAFSRSHSSFVAQLGFFFFSNLLALISRIKVDFKKREKCFKDNEMNHYISTHQNVFAQKFIFENIYKTLSVIYLYFNSIRHICEILFTVHFHYLWFSLTHGHFNFKVKL